MTFAELIVKFGTEGAEKLKSDVSKIGSGFDDASKKANAFKDTVMAIATGNIVGGILSSMGSGLLDLTKSFFQAGMAAETTNARFSAFGLDVNKTNQMLYKVAEVSTLTTEQLKEMTLQLHQSGFNVNAAVPRLAKWADAIGGGSEKLQGMVRLLNLLRAGVKPDQELLQSLGFSDILVKAGLKFDEGKLVGGIRPAIQAVMNEIDRMTSGLTEKVGQTFEARLATLSDFFTRLKEQIGKELISFTGPLIDALNKTLGAVIKSGVIADTIKGFLSIGKGMMDNLSKGIDNKKVQTIIADVVGTILAHFQAIPTFAQIMGESIGIVFEYIGKKLHNLDISLQIFTERLTNPFGGNIDKLKNQYIPDVKLDLSKQQRSMAILKGVIGETAEDYSKRIQAGFGKGPGFTPETEMLRKGATEGSGRDAAGNKDKKTKAEKHIEKQTQHLKKIEDHTRVNAEATLRNMTYGGGMLANQGISDLQLSGLRRGAGSPLINASNDINRGVEKLVRGFQISNSLNINPRRA
jgi:hypothetical protein